MNVYYLLSPFQLSSPQFLRCELASVLLLGTRAGHLNQTVVLEEARVQEGDGVDQLVVLDDERDVDFGSSLGEHLDLDSLAHEDLEDGGEDFGSSTNVRNQRDDGLVVFDLDVGDLRAASEASRVRIE